MRFVRALAVVFVLAALSACGGSSSTPKVTTVPTDPAPAAGDSCPMTVAGTSVTVEETQAGAALVFVTTGDAEALRARVRAWAEAHNARHGAMGALPTGEEQAADGGGEHHHHGGGDSGGGEHAGHEAHGAAGEPMAIGIHSRATESDIDARALGVDHVSGTGRLLARRAARARRASFDGPLRDAVGVVRCARASRACACACAVCS
jgi:hypothetical protein